MKTLICVLLFSSIIINAQVQKLTLRESIELGLKNSRELRISVSKQKSSAARVTEISSQRLPQLRLNAGYSRLSDIPPFQVNLPISPVPITISETILNNYNFRLSFQQPLFTGFRLSSLKNAADFISDASDAELTRDKNEAAIKIETAFWNYYKASQLLNVLNENLSQQERHVKDARNFLDNGLLSKNDLLKLQVQYSNTKLQKIEAENNLDIARMVFNQAVGLETEAKTEIDPEAISTDIKEYNLNEILKEAKEKRTDLKAMEFRVKAAEQSLSASRSGWYPQIYLTGNFYYNRPNQRIMPAEDKFNDTWDVGVSLSWDLWNWGFTSSQSVQAEQSKIQAETSLSQMKDAVDIEVYQNFLTFQRSNEKISVSWVSLEQAKENYRITNEKFNEQLVTTTELIDAQTLLLQAETNYTNTLVDYKLAVSRLEKSIGRRIY